MQGQRRPRCGRPPAVFVARLKLSRIYDVDPKNHLCESVQSAVANKTIENSVTVKDAALSRSSSNSAAWTQQLPEPQDLRDRDEAQRNRQRGAGGTGREHIRRRRRGTAVGQRAAWFNPRNSEKLRLPIVRASLSSPVLPIATSCGTVCVISDTAPRPLRTANHADTDNQSAYRPYTAGPIIAGHRKCERRRPNHVQGALCDDPARIAGGLARFESPRQDATVEARRFR
jgi:hypothetical protein